MKAIKNPHPYHGEALLSYDRYSGVKTFFSSGGKDGEKWAIRQEFDDVSHEVDASRELQKDDGHWDKGVKAGWLHYCHIPDPVLLQWHAMGVNINEPKELLKMVNKPEYAYLKCTGKVHA
jgi:hypothetical protein